MKFIAFFNVFALSCAIRVPANWPTNHQKVQQLYRPGDAYKKPFYGSAPYVTTPSKQVYNPFYAPRHNQNPFQTPQNQYAVKNNGWVPIVPVSYPKPYRKPPPKSGYKKPYGPNLFYPAQPAQSFIQTPDRDDFLNFNPITYLAIDKKPPPLTYKQKVLAKNYRDDKTHETHPNFGRIEEPVPKIHRSEEEKAPISDHENPPEPPKKPIYPGEGQWAIRGLKHRPHITPHKYTELEEDDERPDGYDTFEKGLQNFVQQKNAFAHNLQEFPEKHKLGKFQEEKPNSNYEDKNDDNEEEFIPTRVYAQIRRTEDEKHLPKDPDEPRLREVIKDSKIQTVYSEEGYEDLAYDHAGHEKKAESEEGHKDYKNKKSKSKSKKVPRKYSDSYVDGSENHEILTTNSPKDMKTSTQLYKTQEIKTTAVKDIGNGDMELEIMSEMKSMADPKSKMITHKFIKIAPKINNDQDNDVSNYSAENSETTPLDDVELPTVTSQFTNENEATTLDDIEIPTFFSNFGQKISTTTELGTETTKIPEENIKTSTAKTRRKRDTENEIPKLWLETEFADKINHKLPYTIVPTTFEDKYPYYKHANVDKNSPLRYAENMKNIPDKRHDNLAFYKQADIMECAEVQSDVDPIPEHVKNAENNEDGDESGSVAPAQRLVGLGDKIDCFKIKYFGENPLDSPLFKEEVIAPPEPIFKTTTTNEPTTILPKTITASASIAQNTVTPYHNAVTYPNTISPYENTIPPKQTTFIPNQKTATNVPNEDVEYYDYYEDDTEEPKSTNPSSQKELTTQKVIQQTYEVPTTTHNQNYYVLNYNQPLPTTIKNSDVQEAYEVPTTTQNQNYYAQNYNQHLPTTIQNLHVQENYEVPTTTQNQNYYAQNPNIQEYYVPVTTQNQNYYASNYNQPLPTTIKNLDVQETYEIPTTAQNLDYYAMIKHPHPYANDYNDFDNLELQKVPQEQTHKNAEENHQQASSPQLNKEVEVKRSFHVVNNYEDTQPTPLENFSEQINEEPRPEKHESHEKEIVADNNNGPPNNIYDQIKYLEDLYEANFTSPTAKLKDDQKINTENQDNKKQSLPLKQNEEIIDIAEKQAQFGAKLENPNDRSDSGEVYYNEDKFQKYGLKLDNPLEFQQEEENDSRERGYQNSQEQLKSNEDSKEQLQNNENSSESNENYNNNSEEEYRTLPYKNDAPTSSEEDISGKLEEPTEPYKKPLEELTTKSIQDQDNYKRRIDDSGENDKNRRHEKELNIEYQKEENSGEQNNSSENPSTQKAAEENKSAEEDNSEKTPESLPLRQRQRQYHKIEIFDITKFLPPPPPTPHGILEHIILPSTVAPKYKTISEVSYKDDIKPNEQLNVFTDVLKNIQTSAADTMKTEASNIVDITTRPRRKVIRKKIPKQPIVDSENSASEQVVYMRKPSSNRGRVKFRPTHKQPEDLSESPSEPIPQQEVSKPKKRQPILKYHPIEHSEENDDDETSNTKGSKETVEYKADDVIGLVPPPPPLEAYEEEPINNFYVIGMKPPPSRDVPFTYSDYKLISNNLVKRRANYKPKLHRIGKRSATKAYLEIKRDRKKPESAESEVEEEDDYVPHRPTNYRYDVEKDRIVYDKPRTYIYEEVIKPETTEEIVTLPPKPRTTTRDPNEPTYIDFVLKLKNNKNYIPIPDPEPTKKTEPTTPKVIVTTTSKPTSPPEYLNILSQIRNNKNYKVIEDKTTSKPKIPQTTTPVVIEEEEEILKNVQNAPGGLIIPSNEEQAQVSDSSESVPKVKNYSPRTLVDTSKYKSIERGSAPPRRYTEEDYSTTRNVIKHDGSDHIEILALTTPYPTTTTEKLESTTRRRKRVRGRKRQRPGTPTTPATNDAQEEQTQTQQPKRRPTSTEKFLHEAEVESPRKFVHRRHQESARAQQIEQPKVPQNHKTAFTPIKQVKKEQPQRTSPPPTTQLPETPKTEKQATEDAVEVFSNYDKTKKHGGNYRKIDDQETDKTEKLIKTEDEEETEEADRLTDVVPKPYTFYSDPKLPKYINQLKEPNTPNNHEDIIDSISFERKVDDLPVVYVSKNYETEEDSDEKTTIKPVLYIKDPSKRFYYYAPV